MLKFFKITGHSLYPSYKDGQRVLCKKITQKSSLYINDTIIFEKEPYGLMVKKITEIIVDKYYVRGLSFDSIDSGDFGYLNKEDIKYKIILKL